jgi:hypothetical protein
MRGRKVNLEFWYDEGRRTSGWEDNVKMDLNEIGMQGVDWIHLPQDRDQWRTGFHRTLAN